MPLHGSSDSGELVMWSKSFLSPVQMLRRSTVLVRNFSCSSSGLWPDIVYGLSPKSAARGLISPSNNPWNRIRKNFFVEAGKFTATTRCRSFSSLTADELQRNIDNVNYLFTEARELIADALDSAGTKYFEEDLKVGYLFCFSYIVFPSPNWITLTGCSNRSSRLHQSF